MPRVDGVGTAQRPWRRPANNPMSRIIGVSSRLCNEAELSCRCQRIGPAEGPAETDVAEPLQQAGNRRTVITEVEGPSGTAMFKSGHSFGLPVRPCVPTPRTGTASPSIGAAVARRAVHLRQATGGLDVVGGRDLAVKKRDVALDKRFDPSELYRAEGPGERYPGHFRCDVVEQRIGPWVLCGARICATVVGCVDRRAAEVQAVGVERPLPPRCGSTHAYPYPSLTGPGPDSSQP